MNCEKIKVLIVENRYGDTKLIEKALEKEGNFEIIHGLSDRDKPWLLPADDIDAILLNLSFPGAVGLEILSQIHKLNVKIPIIALNNSFDESEYHEVLKLGAQDYYPLNLLDGSALAEVLVYLCQCRRFGIIPKRSSFATKMEHSVQVVRGADRRLAHPEEPIQ